MNVNQTRIFFTLSKIFLSLMIGFSVGIFLAELVDFDKSVYYILFGMMILLLMVSFFWRREIITKILAVSSIALVLGFSYYGWFQDKVMPHTLPYDQEISFTGIVIGEPDIREDKIKLTIKVKDINSEQGQEVKSIKNLIGQKILINVPRYPEYHYGDKLKISGKLEKPGKIEKFDYGEYLSRYLVFSIITHPTNVECIGTGYGDWFHKILFTIKDRFENTVNQILPEPLAALLAGLLLGVRRNIPESLMNAFNATGTTHIIAISGYNVTIIVRAFERVTKHWSKNLAFILGISGVLLFTILTGASASVVRAAIMASLFLIARQIGRRGDISLALIFVGFLMVLINPFILRFDVGFQLSFLAVLGLIYISPIFDHLFKKINVLVREPLSATLGAQIATIPIILFNFERLSLISPIANVLILPFVPLAMFFGFLAGMIGMVWLWLGQITGWLAWLFLKYIIIIAEWLAKVPWASIEFKFDRWFYIIVYYIILYILVRIMYKRFQLSKSNLV